jgi:hypothetical protein
MLCESLRCSSQTSYLEPLKYASATIVKNPPKMMNY